MANNKVSVSAYIPGSAKALDRCVIYKTIQELYFVLIVNIKAPPNHSAMDCVGHVPMKPYKQHTASHGMLLG